jgi:hypothetical protein
MKGEPMKTREMKPKKRTRTDGAPADPIGAFAWFVSRCAEGLGKELLESGRTETQSRNTVIHLLLDFAAGEACRVARREGRVPDPAKWNAAANTAFDAALKRTAKLPLDFGESK